MSQLPPFEQPFQTISAEFGKAMEAFGSGNAIAAVAGSAESFKKQAGAPRAITSSKDSHFFLVVPFAEKDEAKALGARWNASAKKWYVPAEKDRELFKRWWS